MNRQGIALRFWLAGILILTGMGSLVFLTSRTRPAEFVVVDQIVDGGRKYHGRRVQVTGQVVEGSSSYDEEKPEIAFRMVAIEGPRGELAVRARQVKPDAFQEGGHVIVTGLYDADEGVLVSEDLKAKCPSRYEEQVPGEGGGEGDGTGPSPASSP